MAGNANSGRRQEKPFRDALRVELASIGKDSKALRQIARALIDAAVDGKMDAIREIADRLDGKATQAIEHSGELEVTSKEQRDAAVAAAARANT